MDDREARARRASIYLKALAHEIRLAIVCLLADAGEKTVSELVAHLGAYQAVVSQQLSLLRADGIVSCRRAGRNSFYTLTDPETIPFLRSLSAHTALSEND